MFVRRRMLTLQNVSLRGGKPVWQHHCTQCAACFRLAPEPGDSRKEPGCKDALCQFQRRFTGRIEVNEKKRRDRLFKKSRFSVFKFSICKPRVNIC
jgi:hypothetical protein